MDFYESLLLQDYEQLITAEFQSLTIPSGTFFAPSGITIRPSGQIPIYGPPGSVGALPVNPVNDVSYRSGAGGSNYKFLGATLLSINATVGYNGVPNSLSATVVEDTQNGDLFARPSIPSVQAMGLPSGGVGQPLFPVGSGFLPGPFYFGGILNNYSIVQEDISGRTISISMVDPRELLQGVQVLLGGFALSQNIGDGNPRFTGVNNFIDVFGYYNYGFDSGRDLYGIPWQKCQAAIEATSVKINGISMEFVFDGAIWGAVPSFYKLDDNIIDLLSLCTKVCQDGGGDLLVYTVKADDFTAIVHLIGVQRGLNDPLTLTEVSGFISERASIVSHANVGVEYRSEPTSKVIVGGLRNTNYIAFPGQYDPDMHLTGGQEDYSKWPTDIISRVFGGESSYIEEPSDGSSSVVNNKTYIEKPGAIFPFWGFGTTSGETPLAEPFLSLEHLVFDRYTNQYAHLTSSIPYCRLDIEFLPVRQVPHYDTFLTGDGGNDFRPFNTLSDIKLNYSGVLDGYMRGLPLNTEVLRAALVSEQLFYDIYYMYYPDVASGLKMPQWDWYALNYKMKFEHATQKVQPIENEDPIQYINRFYPFASEKLSTQQLVDPAGRMQKSALSGIGLSQYVQDALIGFNSIIYEQVRQYANDYCGRQFISCLPASPIMQRIWRDLPVPTRVDKPEIEYTVADKGYWEYVPPEFSTVGNHGASGSISNDQVTQIVRRFADFDGRFYPFVAMDWHPSGNVCFNDNGLCRAMFQDLPVDDFRPNQIGAGTPNYIFIASSVQQLVKRPDLALITLPCPVSLDPIDTLGNVKGYPFVPDDIGSQFMVNRIGLMKFLRAQIAHNNDFRNAIKINAQDRGLSFSTVCGLLINSWAQKIYQYYKLSYALYDFSAERVMDLKIASIPLTSNWVRYGPYYTTSDIAPGMVGIEMHDELVPWNFVRPPTTQSWNTNLDQAGNELVQNSIVSADFIDNATITCAGFPEKNIGQQFGHNGNIASICLDFSIGGIKTTYTMQTFAKRPGTFRKFEFDSINRLLFENRPRIIDPSNYNLFAERLLQDTGYFINRFPN